MRRVEHREIRDPHTSTRVDISPYGLIKELDLVFDGTLTQVDVGTHQSVQHPLSGSWDGALHRISLEEDSQKPGTYVGRSADVRFSITYGVDDCALSVSVSAENRGTRPFAPKSLDLALNVETYMDSYPQWNDRFFPTQLRCEPSHMWGYYMSPNGRIITVASPDPIASWSLIYNKRVPAWGRHRLFEDGHRIEGVRLSLMHGGPLPDHHPTPSALAPGETAEWTVVLEPAASLDEVLPLVARNAQAPVLEADRYTTGQGEQSRVTVYGDAPCTLEVTGPGGVATTLATPSSASPECVEVPQDQPGVYRVIATTDSGRQAEARLCRRRPWSWYLKQARNESFKYPPNETGHCESWMTFATWFLARRFVPDDELDARSEETFQDLLPRIFDLETGKTYDDDFRIQNNGMMIALLADHYQATRDRRSLERAQPIADYMMSCQGEDGGFYSPRRGVHYTSVAYLAKGLMELMSCERELASESEYWAGRYALHKRSVRRAIEDLHGRRDNVGTEGEMTFEDGMISCSSLQLAYYALVFEGEESCESFLETAEELSRLHSCLTFLLNPDCRMHGATLRFWESKFNVLAYSNMLNSPCGWTAWKIYGQWYLYQLTGQLSYLRRTMDALGAAVQVIDTETGHLRWAFVPDPYVETLRHVPDPGGTETVVLMEDTVGEQYLEMVSDWYRNQDVVRKTWCIDNLVHEIFKCMAEVALCSTHVYVDGHEEPRVWNGTARWSEGSLVVTPAESLVDAVHVNAPDHSSIDIEVEFASGRKMFKLHSACWALASGETARVRPE